MRARKMIFMLKLVRNSKTELLPGLEYGVKQQVVCGLVVKHHQGCCLPLTHCLGCGPSLLSQHVLGINKKKVFLLTLMMR